MAKSMLSCKLTSDLYSGGSPPVAYVNRDSNHRNYSDRRIAFESESVAIRPQGLLPAIGENRQVVRQIHQARERLSGLGHPGDKEGEAEHAAPGAESSSTQFHSDNVKHLIYSSLQYIDNVLSSNSNHHHLDVFAKLLFSFVVNDCLVHLIVLDICIDDQNEMQGNNSQSSVINYYLDEVVRAKYKQLIQASSQYNPCIAFGLATTLLKKYNDVNLEMYKSIYYRMYEFILSNMTMVYK